MNDMINMLDLLPNYTYQKRITKSNFDAEMAREFQHRLSHSKEVTERLQSTDGEEFDEIRTMYFDIDGYHIATWKSGTGTIWRNPK